MGKKNYNKISTEAAKQVEVEEITEVVETPEIEVTEECTEPKVVECVVTNCERLNIRKNPSLSAKILCVVEAGSEVCMFPEEGPTNDEWSLVVTESGIEGYCMTAYLAEKK